LDNLALVKFPRMVFPLDDVLKRWKGEPNFVRSAPAIRFAATHAGDKEALLREAFAKSAKLLICDRQLWQDYSVDSAQLAFGLGVQSFDAFLRILARVIGKGEEAKTFRQPRGRIRGLTKLTDAYFGRPGNQKQVDRVSLKKWFG